MVQQGEINSGCATEVDEGTAYQSWDWQDGKKVGAEFNSFEPIESGPWGKEILSGDSKWKIPAWNCQTKVETFGEFGSLPLEEQNWFNATLGDIENGKINLAESWHFKIKWDFNEGWIKLVEIWRNRIRIPWDESWVLFDRDFLKTYPSYFEKGIWSEALRLILVWTLNAGFLGLQEVNSIRFSFVVDENWKLAESDFMKLYSINSDSGIWNEAIRLKLIYNFDEGWFKIQEALAVEGSLFWSDSEKLSELFSVVLRQTGYGANGYGMIGYGV